MSIAIALESVTATHPLQTGAEFGGTTTIEWTRAALLGILGYGLLAGIGALAVAFGYRALTVRELPIGPAVLVGLALPSGWLTAEALRHGEVIVDSPLVHYTSGTFLFGVLFVGCVAAVGGHRLGDHLACGVYEITAIEASGPVADLVQSAGLAIVVSLPGSIDDAEGYPSVDDERKQELADREFLLPSGLSVPERRSRLESRIESDYDVGYVRADLSEEGAVATIAVGDRQTGVSPTLGPDQVAVAIAGDPSPRASAGDPIEVWTADEGSSRLVTTGTLRASAGPITTVVVDADDVDAFEPDGRYQLTTRPETPSDGHALVSAIRAADETVVAITVEDGGPLESEFAGWVPGTVLAIDRDDEVLTVPADKEPLAAGDTIYVFGTPAELRELATGLGPSIAPDTRTEQP
ncbi:hypothetical protein [Natronorubrum sp. FCH18a]|uniref:hypothetical protein n=1 Tax=Natronorubrum sp. FCH18a TaxID=3447018 RepID=UPI003F514C35